MVRITSTELRNQFGHFGEIARREPVSITDQGSDGLVLLSAAEFERLKTLDTRQALYAWELPDDIAAALDAAQAPEWTARFDAERNE